MTHHIKPFCERPEIIKRRGAGRHMAPELYTLIDGDTADRVYMESLIEELRLKSSFAEPTPEVASKPEPIARLAANTMPFGAHVGKTFDEVPLAYLDWLCRSQEDF